MKSRFFFPAVLLLLVLLSAGSPTPACQDQQEESKAKAGQTTDSESTGTLDVVDGKFNKALPVVLSLKTCSGATVELKGTCHIKGSIESAQEARFLVSLDASIDLSGSDDSIATPYKVSFARQVKNHLDKSTFDVIYYQNPSEGENVTSFTIRLKFEADKISLVSAKANGCLKEGKPE